MVEQSFDPFENPFLGREDKMQANLGEVDATLLDQAL